MWTAHYVAVHNTRCTVSDNFRTQWKKVRRRLCCAIRHVPIYIVAHLLVFCSLFERKRHNRNRTYQHKRHAFIFSCCCCLRHLFQRTYMRANACSCLWACWYLWFPGSFTRSVSIMQFQVSVLVCDRILLCNIKKLNAMMKMKTIWSWRW